MKRLILCAVICMLASAMASATFELKDPAQPDETEPTWSVDARKDCPDSSKCVDENATCFEDYPCGSDEGFVCASKYGVVLEENRNLANQYNELISDNVELREQRLEQKNCVLNASSLAVAQSCVR